MAQFIIGLCIGLCIGYGVGLFLAALFRANDTVETCPKCNGVCGFETGPNDWL